ncbi:histidine kinase [Vibrio azureus]|uniref:histidine kinase n=1 Tax=Vibrio azureus NBRC 104587 TaxID=1219077 RepID=U3AVW7_9VIBR|nr:sensor histidine kinase VxrA [Vibrio azureus]AUI88220.1 histidine kinase [Vibrio azureus]GAD77895.1 hypothetical protein VAZ01S_098_00040 [Vibrio azureus NBRC 104587]
MIKQFLQRSAFILSLLSPAAIANTLPERIDTFKTLFNYQIAEWSYDTRELRSTYPTKLISPDSMFPQTTDYPLKDIQLLYRLSQTCRGKLPLNPSITEPLVFTRAMCNSKKLKPSWFKRSGLIHPGGGTYAARYINIFPDSKDKLLKFMHVKERPNNSADHLLTSLKNMDEDTINAFIRGASMFIEGQDLWLLQGDHYFVFPKKVWAPKISEAGLSFELSAVSNHCFVKRGNICWDLEDHSALLQIGILVLVIANILLVIGWSVYRWNSKREELRSRMLVLQILTHELRTPIASLSLTVEGFRREFEHLPENLYEEFRRLCEDTRRLRQLAEASKDYLQSDNQMLATEWVQSVEEWLEYKIEEEFSGVVTLNINHDVAAKVNVYWLGTCIDNLLKNAIKYGVAPVELHIQTSVEKLIIQVKDAGNLTEKDWQNLRKPFVSANGLGLGLTIVESMVGRMGGKMHLAGPPTTFTLEIPCETDAASR